MKEKGYTLIELLATIVILGIILAIAVPTVGNLIRKATINAFESDAKLLIKAINYRKLVDDNFNPLTINVATASTLLQSSTENYKSISVSFIDNNEVYIIIVGQKKWDGLVAYGTYQYMTVEGYQEYDNEAPVISLIGNAMVTIQIGESYTDAGATAIDDMDGDVTEKIVVSSNLNSNVVGVYEITYDVTDSVGNEALTVTRIINVIDASSPVITIKGSNPVNVEVGDTYIDEGATAIDNVDGDITDKIQVTGTINPNIVDTYTVTYTVSDIAGNTVIAIRTVNVVDTTIPLVTFSPQNNSVYVKSTSTTVNVTDRSDLSVLKYLWTMSTTSPNEEMFTTIFTNNISILTPSNATGVYYLWILAKDIYNNTTIQSSGTFYLDNTVPSIPSVSLNGYVSGGWTKSNVTQTFSSTDTASGILKYQYSNNGGSTWNDISNPWVINFDGEWTLYIRAIDKAGNISGSSSAYVVRRDTVPPAIPSVNLNGYASGSWTRGNVTQTLNSSDATSGLASYQYSHDNANFAAWPANPWTINWDGQWNFYTRAVDNAGNVSGSAGIYTIRRDTVAPTISMYGSNPVYTREGSVYSDAGAGASDDASGLAGGISITNTVNPNAAGTYYVYYNINDNAGNPAAQQIRTVYVQETLLGRMEATFGKGTGGCVPGSVSTADGNLNADSYCYFKGGTTVTPSSNNYIYFNCDAYPSTGCQKWRILGVKKDSAGTIGVRILAPAGVAPSMTYGTADNIDWDSSSATIRTNLNNGAQSWFKDNVEGDKATWLVSMKYDKRQSPNDIFDLTTTNYISTSTSSYVALPSHFDIAQCMNNINGSAWNSAAGCWAVADSTDVWHWLIGKFWDTQYTYDRPGAWTSLKKANSDNFGRTTASMAVRPIVNLKPTLMIVGGNGASGSPYQIAP